LRRVLPSFHWEFVCCVCLPVPIRPAIDSKKDIEATYRKSDYLCLSECVLLVVAAPATNLNLICKSFSGGGIGENWLDGSDVPSFRRHGFCRMRVKRLHKILQRVLF
jgi:hypothetical protein